MAKKSTSTKAAAATRKKAAEPTSQPAERQQEQVLAEQAEQIKILQAQLAALKDDLARPAEGQAGSGADASDPYAARRIAEFEQTTTRLRNEMEAQQDRLGLLDAAQQKQLADTTRQLDDFKRAVDEAREDESRHKQQLTGFGQRLTEFHQFIEEWRAHKQLYEQQYQRSRQVLEKLEALQTQLTTRHNEVAEMQRIGEGRVKRQWEEWQATARQDMRNQQAAAEEQSRVHERRIQELKDSIDQLAERVDAHQELVAALIDISRAQLERARETADLVSRADRILTSTRLSGQRQPK